MNQSIHATNQTKVVANTSATKMERKLYVLVRKDSPWKKMENLVNQFIHVIETTKGDVTKYARRKAEMLFANARRTSSYREIKHASQASWLIFTVSPPLMVIRHK